MKRNNAEVAVMLDVIAAGNYFEVLRRLYKDYLL